MCLGHKEHELLDMSAAKRCTTGLGARSYRSLSCVAPIHETQTSPYLRVSKDSHVAGGTSRRAW